MSIREINEPVVEAVKSLIEVFVRIPAERDIFYTKEVLKSIQTALEVAKGLGIDTSDVTLGSLLAKIFEAPKLFPFLGDIRGRIEGYIREESGGEGSASFNFPLIGGLLGGGGSGYSREVESGSCLIELKVIYNELNQDPSTMNMSRMLEMKIPELTNILETKIKVYETQALPVIDGE